MTCWKSIVKDGLLPSDWLSSSIVNKCFVKPVNSGKVASTDEIACSENWNSLNDEDVFSVCTLFFNDSSFDKGSLFDCFIGMSKTSDESFTFLEKIETLSFAPVINFEYDEKTLKLSGFISFTWKRLSDLKADVKLSLSKLAYLVNSNDCFWTAPGFDAVTVEDKLSVISGAKDESVWTLVNTGVITFKVVQFCLSNENVAKFVDMYAIADSISSDNNDDDEETSPNTGSVAVPEVIPCCLNVLERAFDASVAIDIVAADNLLSCSIDDENLNIVVEDEGWISKSFKVINCMTLCGFVKYLVTGVETLSVFLIFIKSWFEGDESLSLNDGKCVNILSDCKTTEADLNFDR